ncbi:MAG: FG-GAP repeat protein [Enhydrobacter sp.]|nr:FG-GAP repeat protein [Enhydrobacter sp.]
MAQFPATIDIATLDGSTGFKLSGAASGDRSGFSVSSAGDVNGDGFADVIVGAPYADPDGTSSGAAYVVFGKASGFAADFDLASLDGSNGFRLTGVGAGNRSGFSVASADVNGDGFADMIVGASGPYGDYSAGYVVYGKGTGFGATVELADLNGSNGFKVSKVSKFSRAGENVAAAGDVNGDGVGDMLFGTQVLFGSRTGFPANVDLVFDGTNGFAIGGEASAGDINGDGFADLIGGEPGWGEYSYGRGYVVFGRASPPPTEADKKYFYPPLFRDGAGFGFAVSGAGDVNGDGFDDFMIGSPGLDEDRGRAYLVLGNANGTIGLNQSIGGGGDRTGFLLSAAGDVNGDGFADTIICASYGAYVVFGKPSDLWDGSLWMLDGSDGFRVAGLTPGSRWAVSSAGDVNGDGFDDILVGVSGATGSDSPGASYVIFGRMPDMAVNRVGTVASQTLAGGTFDDTLSGLGGDDSLFGNGGDDLLEGGAGNDRLKGGDGIDTASYASAPDGVTVDLGIAGPQDTVGAGTDTLDGIENLVGSAGADRLTGDNLVNRLAGGAGDDVLEGRNGNDVLDGGEGDDALEGGKGNDTVDGGVGFDVASYASASGGVTVSLRIAGAQDTLGAGVDTLAGIEGLAGSAHADSLEGNDAANLLSGAGGDDQLHGRGGDDVLEGGAGNDLLKGGDGIDSASYASASAGVSVDLEIAAGQNTGAAGIDTLNSIEGLVGSSFGDVLRGNKSANTLSGGAGDDVLEGRNGDDVLDGGAGADLLDGGKGNDLYIVRDAADVIATDSSGINTVQAWLSYTLANGLANLVLSGAADLDGTGNGAANGMVGNGGANRLAGLDGDDVLSGEGGDDALDGGLGNDTAHGGDGDDIVRGREGDDRLYGDDGNDELLGAQGNDVVSGGAGDDLLAGGEGDDLIDGGDGTDTVQYLSAAGGVTVDLDVTSAQNTGVAGIDTLANIENATGSDAGDRLSGTGGANLLVGNGGDDVLVGRNGDDVLDGGIGNDRLSGGGGNDELRGREGDDNLDGGAGDDELLGAQGNDAVKGEAGDDLLAGGDGNDLLDGGDGIDTAQYGTANVGVTVDLALAGPQDTLGAGIDTLAAIENLAGSAYGDQLFGTDQSNWLLGEQGDDLLFGRNGDDVLDGGEGADTMDGGKGDDLYLVDNTGDIVNADAGGNDTVQASVSFTLGAGLDNLVLTGAAPIDGTGNAAANAITGNGAANRLSGKGGADMLTGGGGFDMFVFDTPLVAGEVTTITDFSADKILLSRAAFKGIGPAGPLQASAFGIGTAAFTPEQRIIYTAATGALQFDPDGSGSKAAVQFATLSPHLSIAAGNFEVIA